jgi:hypothetical protein
LRLRDFLNFEVKDYRYLVGVLFRPQKSLDMPIERFLASLRFEQRGKLDQLGIEIGSFD